MKKKSKQVNVNISQVLGRILIYFLFFGLALSCISHKVIKLSYLDSYQIPANAEISETIFGGISGIEYDKNTNIYYLVSDDRSDYNSARMYKAKIIMTSGTIDTVVIGSVIDFSNPNKLPYAIETVDIESLRYNPKTKLFVVGDEGGKKGVAALKMIDLDGQFKDEIKMDSNYTKHIRFNKSFESLSFSQDYLHLYYATEAPLVSDGIEASKKDRGLLRIIKTDSSFEIQENEFLYWLEKVPQKPEVKPPWDGPGSDNGLSELLALPNHQFLTLERSGAYKKDGSFNYICKIFHVFPRGIKKGSLPKTLKTKKKKVYDFSTLPGGKFNVEGMTFGPPINGKPTLLFVTDNNFKENIPTMLYLFKINTLENE